MGFHRRKAVAPLKRWWPGRRPSSGILFPPPKGGGPIEAVTSHKMRAWQETKFPPPKGGGPIEARRSRAGAPVCLARFHRRKAVAPLKPL